MRKSRVGCAPILGRRRPALCCLVVIAYMLTALLGCSRPVRLQQIEIYAVPWGLESRSARSIGDILADADIRLVIGERRELEPIERCLKTLRPLPPGVRPRTANFGVNMVARFEFVDGNSMLLAAPTSCDWFADGTGKYYEFAGKLFELLIANFAEEARTEILDFPRCRDVVWWARAPRKADDAGARGRQIGVGDAAHRSE
jgi:hypothetical protein